MHFSCDSIRAKFVRVQNKKRPFKTYEMARHPVHVGVSKGWLTWHSQNITGFQQQQPYTVVQDEVVRRFIRGFFPSNLIGRGDEVGALT